MPTFPLYLFLAAILISCGHQTTHSNQDTVAIFQAPRPDMKAAPSSPPVPPAPSKEEHDSLAKEDSIFQAHQPNLLKAEIQLLSLKKGWNSRSSSPPEDYPASRRWKLDSLTILQLLQKAAPADDMFLDLGPFEFLPGAMEGEVLVNGERYNYLIDAGGYMYLEKPGGHSHYCYYWTDKVYSKYFLPAHTDGEDD